MQAEMQHLFFLHICQSLSDLLTLACRMRDLTGTEPWAWQTQRRHMDRDGGSRIGKKGDDEELIGSEMDLKIRSL
jgi:hypothetical protein